MKKCILVLGMHRGGTSATAGLLSLMGVDLGKGLLPGNQYNPKGYFEDPAILSLHEDIMSRLGSRWWDLDEVDTVSPTHQIITAEYRERLAGYLEARFDKQEVFAVKDPRITRLLPLWHSIFLRMGWEPRYVIVVRNPAEVVASLLRRDGTDEVLSYLLWSREMLFAEQATRGSKRVLVHYDHILRNPLEQAGKINQELGLELRISPTQEELIGQFIDQSLNRSGMAAGSPHDPRQPQVARQLHQALMGLCQAQGASPEQLFKVIDEIGQGLDQSPLWRLGRRCQDFLQGSKVHFQIMADLGQGEGMQASLGCTQVYDSQNIFSLETKLDLPLGPRVIRVDPANHPGVLSYLRLKITAGDRQVALIENGLLEGQIKLINLRLCAGGVLVATTSDPQILIWDTVNEAAAVEIQCELAFMRSQKNQPAVLLSQALVNAADS